MNAALMLVSNATVPWSDRVKNIVEQGLNSNHPRYMHIYWHNFSIFVLIIISFPLNFVLCSRVIEKTSKAYKKMKFALNSAINILIT